MTAPSGCFELTTVRDHKSEEVFDTLTKPRRERFTRFVAIRKTLKLRLSGSPSPGEDLADVRAIRAEEGRHYVYCPPKVFPQRDQQPICRENSLRLPRSSGRKAASCSSPL